MNLHNWKLFTKQGSLIDWSPSPYINLNFSSPTGRGAKGFLVTDPSKYVTSAEITNGGYLYDNDDVSISYSYAYLNGSVILSSTDVSIFKTDVSIFNPEPTNTKSISSLNVVLNRQFNYPSVTYAGALFLNPVSQGLVETEHLFIFEEAITGFIRPYDASNPTLIMKFVGDDEEIQFFEVDEHTQEVSWYNEITFDTSILAPEIPLQVNIGFKSDIEGVFERILRIYHQVGDQLVILADIAISAEAIGEDERFRTLLANFGLPDPKDIPQIFKETDINEDNLDWKVLNYKSKHMILEHDKIMPYIGTYKGLINAVKWLGYDDIYFREWFVNVKEQNRKVSFVVPFNAADRTQTILMFTPEQRKKYKKLNQLSLNYCITRETGILDDRGMPETENCYTYNLKEVYIKLLGLKQWLERNIIGVNCRITDITGDGIYFERIQNLVYVTDNIGYDYRIEQTLTPKGVYDKSELTTGDASVALTFLELSQTSMNDLQCSFGDMMQFAWTPIDPCVYYNTEDPSYLADPSSFLHGGATFAYPFRNISDIMWRLSVIKDNAGVISENLVTNPLFIYENEIRFYDIYDSSSIFFDTSTHLALLLEKAYLRDPNIDEWERSIAYSIYADPCNNYDYIMESSLGILEYFNGYVSFLPTTNARLQYAVDTNYKVPLLSFKNFTYRDSCSNVHNFNGKEYYLDILDGKVYMDAGVTDSSDYLKTYLNWNYDTSLSEQQITVNHVYESNRLTLWQTDPSAYYWNDPCVFTGGTGTGVMLIDNSVYILNVNHTGEYNIELFAWDAYNTILHNVGRDPYKVYIKNPTAYTLLDVSMYLDQSSPKVVSPSETMEIANNDLYPIYDRYVPLQGLKLEFDVDGNPYLAIPSITYFQDVPEPGSVNRFFNLTERITSMIDTSIVVDEDYQEFYTGDDVRLVKFDKGKFTLLEEVSSRISYAAGSQPTTIALDQIPASFVMNASNDFYIINDTYRTTVNQLNNTYGMLAIDISGYIFTENQLVGIIATNVDTGYTWGSSYRVVSVDGSTHTFDNAMPEFLMNTSTYTIQAKHAYTTFAEFTINTSTASETNNEFKVYLKNSYCQEYYLDNTFIYTNLLFDHDRINVAWYNPSTYTIDASMYYYNSMINVDASTFVIFRAEYETSTYMKNQKNIWTIRFNEDDTVYLKVFNYSVPIIIDTSARLKVLVESYDSYGNLVKTGVE